MNYIEKYFLNLDETASKKTPLDSREGVRALFESVLEAKREAIFENSLITFCEQNGIDYNSLNEEQINEIWDTIKKHARKIALGGALGLAGLGAAGAMTKEAPPKFPNATAGWQSTGKSWQMQGLNPTGKKITVNPDGTFDKRTMTPNELENEKGLHVLRTHYQSQGKKDAEKLAGNMMKGFAQSQFPTLKPKK